MCTPTMKELSDGRTLKDLVGWLFVDVGVEAIESAKRMRAARDERYRNIFSEVSTDMCWVGDLGETVFDAWVRGTRLTCKLVVDEAAGNPDFVTHGGTRIGVKTVKRKAKPRADYTAQITARHAEEPIDQFFFMSYENEIGRMWLLGGIARERFLQQAVYHPAGAQVHENYRIRPGHEIYNILISKLVPPNEWLADLT